MRAETITVSPVKSAADRKAFLDLPARLHAADPNWIAPLRREEAKKLDARRHPFYEHGEGAFFLARRGGRVVGRIAALINHLHIERYKDATGHFGLLESEDDPIVFEALLSAARAWLRERGMARIMGPYNLSINEELGLLIEGDDTPPVILMGHAPRYYCQRLEALGFSKAKDLYAYWIDTTAQMPAAYDDRLREMLSRTDVVMRSATKKTIAADLRLGIDIFNDAWSENWGFVPITDREGDDFVKTVRQIAIPEGVVFAEKNGRAIGIMAAIPNVNEAIHDVKGRLLPFGWLKLLWRLKVRRLKTGRLFLLGVRKEAHGTLTGAMLPILLLESLRPGAVGYGIRAGEMSWVLEDNKPVIKYMKDAGLEPYKTYRIYEAAI